MKPLLRMKALPNTRPRVVMDQQIGALRFRYSSMGQPDSAFPNARNHTRPTMTVGVMTEGQA